MAIGEGYANELGCRNITSRLACLRALSPRALVSKAQSLHAGVGRFAPSVDGVQLLGNPLHLVSGPRPVLHPTADVMVSIRGRMTMSDPVMAIPTLASVH